MIIGRAGYACPKWTGGGIGRRTIQCPYSHVVKTLISIMGGPQKGIDGAKVGELRSLYLP